ncbi:hypothetical protein GGQ61_004309 [Phenylobacterium haematophilum]|uniref:Probable membrane transporter protein n=1 Tax=Phenylobacterium haematophilum TaxID=98513 RepID=A0A840A7Z0_9CAUL|nr:TSUP family transporter [Phenylobacterium haematophilum]MBB3893561.1 hypothetical protein [Phenylobacterium haematophilum]
MFAELGPQAVALLCVAALAAGFVDAIAGGGGLITVPALLAAGVDPVSAIATNKVQGSVGTASATWTFWRAGRIDLQAIKLALVMALVGAVAGALAVMVVDTRWLMLLLPIMLVAIALYFLLGPKIGEQDQHARLSALGYGLVAGGIGFYDGFFGPGAGSFYTLSLVTLLGMGLVRATAHTKVLNLTSNLVSVVVLGLGGHVLWALGGAMAVGQFVGGRLGSRAAMRWGPRLIRPLLVVISLAMTAKLLADPANPLREMIARALY